jgi:DNA-binding CsgD family transcriptional regulator/PAS domain-containing protein
MSNSGRLSTASLSNLIERLYEAAAETGLWPKFLESLNQQLGAERGSLLIHCFESGDTGRQGTQLFQSGFDPEAVQLYNRHYGKADPYAKGFFERNVRSEVGYCADLVDYDALRRGEFYHDFLKPFDTFYLCWIAVRSPGRATALSLVRSETRGPFNAGQLRVLALLTPHLRQALQIARRFEVLEAGAASAKRTVEAFDIAVLSVDEKGRVIHLSRPAEALLRRQSGVRLKNRRLAVSDSGVQTRLDLLLQGAIWSSTGRALEESFPVAKLVELNGHRKVVSSPASGGAVLIEGEGREPPLELTVVPFRSETMLQEESPAALVFLGGSGKAQELLPAILRDLYCLTPAEVLLALKIGEGVELRTAAEELRITEETARHRLKQIFQKTGVSRQPELVRLIAKFPKR